MIKMGCGSVRQRSEVTSTAHALVSLLPIWHFLISLLPVNDYRLITPFLQLGHCLAMGTGVTKLLHGCGILPEGEGPSTSMSILQELAAQESR